jgi:hypothetical protein
MTMLGLAVTLTAETIIKQKPEVLSFRSYAPGLALSYYNILGLFKDALRGH